MSTQNFVSYGDAETLMSGIAEKIGQGGGGTVTKKVLYSVSDTSKTLNEVCIAISTLLNNLPIDKLNKINLYIYRDNGSSVWKINLKLFSIVTTENQYRFGSVNYNNSNYVFAFNSSGFAGAYLPTSISDGSTTLSANDISSIEVYYSEIEDITSAVQTELDSLDARVDALEQSGGRTVVATLRPSSTSNQTVASALLELIPYLQNLSETDKEKCYIKINGISELNSSNYIFKLIQWNNYLYEFYVTGVSTSIPTGILINSSSNLVIFRINNTSFGEELFRRSGMDSIELLLI